MLTVALFLAIHQGSQEGAKQDPAKTLDAKPTAPVSKEAPPVVIKALDLVEVHYTGKLTNGKVFDSSVPKNKPFRFQVGVGAVIKGWDQGVLGLKVGDVKDLTVPPELGYGSQAMGDDIPANSTLLFNIQILKVIPAATIEVLKEGTGEGLKLGQGVEVRLVLRVKDGKELGKTPEGKPDTLGISREVPAGINQGIAGIKAGEKRRVTMNSDLMWGDAGVPARDTSTGKAGSVIPGKATIVMEVEAFKILN